MNEPPTEVAVAVLKDDGTELTEREKAMSDRAALAGAASATAFSQLGHDYPDASEQEQRIAFSVFAVSMGASMSAAFGDAAPGILDIVAQAAKARAEGEAIVRGNGAIIKPH